MIGGTRYLDVLVTGGPAFRSRLRHFAWGADVPLEAAVNESRRLLIEEHCGGAVESFEAGGEL